MTEKQLIAKLKELSQIKPREDWVVLAKKDILGKEREGFSFGYFLKEIYKGEKFIFQHKPAFVTLVSLLVLIGVFGFAQNSLPGDSLYSIRKIAEKSQAVFISERGQIRHNFGLANRRLDDLAKVVESNSARNLGPAINEFQASVVKAVESLAEAEKGPQIIKEIAFEVKKLEEKAEKVKSLGIEIGESEELDQALFQIIEEQIKDLESRTLNEEEAELLSEAKESFQQGDYSQALEKILLLNQ